MTAKIDTLEELRWYRFEHDLSAKWLLAAYRIFKQDGFVFVG
jgi:hypothetical protein